MLFDSHCHLQFSAFDDDRKEVIQRLIENRVAVINVGSCVENSYEGLKLTQENPGFMWASAGVHPFHSLPFIIFEDNEEASSLDIHYPQDISQLKDLLINPKVVAVGECGLDFSCLTNIHNYELHQNDYQNYQYQMFRKQIQLAKEFGKPLILHIRKLYQEAIQVLEEEKFQGKAIFHFFKGRQKDLEKILENPNYYLSFSGVITYDSSLDKIIAQVPLERLLIETDAPYVAPIPYKGQKNEPLFVKYIAEYIARVKKLSLSQIEKITYGNTLKAFNIQNE